MGCASSKEDKEPTLVGGGTDGWAAGSPAPKQPPNPARPHLPHTSVDSLATSSNGTATARQAAAPPPSQPTRQSKQQAAAGAAPAVALADVVLREDVDGVHSFSAYVLADFEASVLGVELSVKKGEWVAVTVDGDDEPPEGWWRLAYPNLNPSRPNPSPSPSPNPNPDNMSCSVDFHCLLVF